MTEQKATLEQVRRAYDDLVGVGQTPSAANVLKLTGGSKSTVLKLLRAVRSEKVSAKPQPEVPLALLQAVGEPLIRQLWSAAEQMAIKLYEARIADLTTVLNGMLEDLKSHEVAEDRIADLEGQLARRDDFEGQLRGLKAMVEEMHGKQPAGRPTTATTTAKTTAVMSVLNIILASDPVPVSKQQIDREMLIAGHKDAASQKARWRVVDGGYVEPVGDALRLTEVGRRKLKLPLAS